MRVLRVGGIIGELGSDKTDGRGAVQEKERSRS